MRTEIDIIAQKAWAREEGKTEGKAEGLAEGRADVARNFRDMGLPLEQISKATGLSIEQIAAL